jgi:hypothetical protein
VGDSPYGEADNLIELVMKLPDTKEPTLQKLTTRRTAPVGNMTHKHILLDGHFSVFELLRSHTGIVEMLRCAAG